MHLEQLDNLWENSGVDQIFCRIAVLHAIAKGCPMADVKAQNALAAFPTAKEVMEQIALKEAEKASAAANEFSAAEAEKRALIEKLSKPSGVSDEERLARAVAIIKRAANNGLTEVEVVRFPNELCTDRGRAINQREAGWKKNAYWLPEGTL